MNDAAPPSAAKSPGRTVLKTVAIVLGGLVGLALAVAGVIGLGLLFWLLLREMAVAVGRAIVDAVKDAFNNRS
ncbi:MAG TPA: hypothetical protein VFB78_19540 [Acidimicrobiales bacterium]|nr:hypothetical protein [Acidimicrobiales bacterium]